MALASRIQHALDLVRRWLTDSTYFWHLATLVLVGDAVLTQLVIRFVSYTEIDWDTYMQQVNMYIKGERNYSNISGPTGPLVYPAGHVHIYQTLHLLTNGGSHVYLAQQIYAGLYLLSVFLTLVIYRRAGNVPNWVVCLLPLSKRLHSIYVLRLFNDPWAVVILQTAIVGYQYGLDDLASALFSIAISVKMSVLLYLPGLLVILYLRHGLSRTVLHISGVIALQVAIGYPFISASPSEYLAGAFELSRVFLYKWTVNWRFVSEDTFLSPEWARGLMLGHIATLVLFGWGRWCQRPGGLWAVLGRGLRRPTLPAGLGPVSSDYIATVLFTSNIVGILFARSLHYQFYSWYAQTLPFLVCRTKYPWVVRLALLAGIELSWNVYPSTPLSSALLCASNALVVLGVWFGWSEGVR